MNGRRKWGLAIVLMMLGCAGTDSGDSRVTGADRASAAARAAALGLKPGVSGRAANGPAAMPPPALDPGGIPHYFGPYANYAYSPLPKGPITGIALDVGGSGYAAPTVTISDVYGTGTGATATATLTGDVITAVNLTNPGTGYSAPIVFINDTTGTGAVAVATVGDTPGSLSGGLRKFVNALPGLYISGVTDPGSNFKNENGQYIPVAVPESCTYSGQQADCYVIELVEYREQMHADLPPVVGTWPNQTGGTLLRGYMQTNTTDPLVKVPHYMGPIIIAQKDRPVRITFKNMLPTGADGNLFLPVDTTVMGAGMGPLDMMGMPGMKESYTQNRATLHLHGGLVPWISDGTAQQWTTPAGETTQYPKGVGVYNVPDMPHPGTGAVQGELTFYYNNEQSARLMFYHDHAFGITRLNVYAGEAAGYLLTDQAEQDLINGTNVTGANPTSSKVLPDVGIPLIIQDRSFVDPTTLAAQDPTWPFTPHDGDLWYPHVYMPNQNPADLGGMNAFGRWHYGPWYYPPTTTIAHGPVPNPYCLPTPPAAGTYPNGPYDCSAAPWENAYMPGSPNPSIAAEGFMDTPIVNGAAYPYLVVDPKAYRFRILNAADDRFWNLQFYVADPTVTTSDGRTNTEVKLVPYPAGATGYPVDYVVADPTTAGPSFIQIGTDGGFLPKPAVLPNKPVAWNGDPMAFDFGVVNQGTLIMAPAERADVIVDFSAYAGKTLILYNDSPAPFPAIDYRYDYFTGGPDNTATGGTPPTLPGYGPNTRTIMQIRVNGSTPAPAYDLAALQAVFAKTAAKRGVFEVSQAPIVVPNTRYDSAYDATFPSVNATAARIYDTAKTFSTISGTTLTLPFQGKTVMDAMSEVFDDYGRMNGMLGLMKTALPGFIPYPYTSPPVDMVKFSMTPMTEPSPGDNTQIWRINQNGVDTHSIHFHLFNVQLVNRVAWDNAVRLPDANELGWKDTLRMNPLQDAIVALKPVAPLHQPFKVPNSVRTIDPTMPENSTLAGPLPDGFQDPTGTHVSIANSRINYGWEYMYHCHILGHEEMNMMHSVVALMPPEAPSGLNAALTNGTAALTWTDNSLDETGFKVVRATDAGFTTNVVTRTLAADATAYTDTSVAGNKTYYFKVLATNVVGSTAASNFTQPAAPGFPTMSADSEPSNTASLTVISAPTNLTAKLLAGPSRVRLAWTDNATNETGYRIERRVNGGAFTQIAAPGPRAGTGNVSYTDNNVTIGATYAYRVRAASASGFSVYSNTAAISRVGFTK
ncbi:MAG: multicopper oxidase domain-containing protein [Deltaproteobacteria bacterium]|nr:multicopper oxidase domain-containing protein [Deltaproteobacteria bacterium]